MVATSSPSWRELWSFFWPLALQAAVQSISYPLVAIVATQAPGGAKNLAGLAQATAVMFLLGTLGAGIITTGMVYASSREGFRKFCNVNYMLAGITATLQAIIALPPVSHAVFSGIIGLPAEIEAPARSAFLLTIPLQVLFFLRNPFQVMLYKNKATIRASSATVLRIIVTLVLAAIFCSVNLTGPRYAVLCLMIPILVEIVMSWRYARSFIQALPVRTVVIPRYSELFKFTLTLSVSGFFLTLSGMVVGAIIARSAAPDIMLPAYYLALGLVAPVAFAATRIQTLVLTFSRSDYVPTILPRFAGSVAILLGIIPLVSILPGIADLYYCTVQHFDPTHLNSVRIAVGIFCLYPPAVLFRLFIEGRAAVNKKPSAVVSGQSVFLVVVGGVSFALLALGAPGSAIGPIALVTANVLSGSMTAFMLRREKSPEVIVAASVEEMAG